MNAIDFRRIEQWAAGLAHHLWPLLRARPATRQFHLQNEARLAGVLNPAVAAFIGRLMTLTPRPVQLAQLPAALGAFFADPSTAAGLDRYAAGQTEAADELLERLLAAGLDDGLPLRVYFGVALDTLLAAAEASVWREPPGAPLEQDETPPPLPALFADVSPYLFADVKRFVAAYFTAGLGYVALGRAVAGDGATVIFTWDPAPMAGALPPDEGEKSVPPEEAMTGGEEPPADMAGEAGETAEPPAVVETVAPPAPPPPPGPEETVVALRLDAALPERVTVGRAFDLAVAVKRPGSPQLAPDDLARRESADFGAVWPTGAAFIRLRVQISAPECLIHGGDSRDVRLPAAADGPPVYFQLTPQRTGPLSVIITVYQETDWVGSTRLRTEAGGEEPRGKLAMTVESHPLGNGDVTLVRLREALDAGYNDSELRDLCFELGVDYEDLAGGGQSDKARELVLYVKRHNLTAQLVAHVMRDRPHLLVTTDA